MRLVTDPIDRSAILLSAAAVLLIAAAASATESDPPTIAGDPAAGDAGSDTAADAAGADEIEVPDVVVVSLLEWSLDPGELTLPAGTYTFEAPNDGSIGHSLLIVGEELSVGTPDISYPPGVSQSFTVDLAPGTYELLCPLPWHRQTGMVGELSVTL